MIVLGRENHCKDLNILDSCFFESRIVADFEVDLVVARDVNLVAVQLFELASLIDDNCELLGLSDTCSDFFTLR